MNENIALVSKEYVDAHFGNTSETNDNLVIASKEYVDSRGVCIEYRDTNDEHKTYKTYWGLSDLEDCSALGIVPRPF